MTDDHAAEAARLLSNAMIAMLPPTIRTKNEFAIVMSALVGTVARVLAHLQVPPEDFFDRVRAWGEPLPRKN